MTFEARDRGIKSEGKILKDVFLLTNCVCSSQTSVFDTNLHLITMLDTHMLFTVWEVRMANYCMRGPKITSDFFSALLRNGAEKFRIVVHIVKSWLQSHV